jgi:hypothetical protein
MLERGIRAFVIEINIDIIAAPETSRLKAAGTKDEGGRSARFPQLRGLAGGASV